MGGRRSFPIAIAVFVAGAIVLVWDLGSASPAVEWMNIYRVSDAQVAGDPLGFIIGLRVPIPPNLALLEIASYQVTGTTWFATVFLYKAYIVVAFTCVLVLAYPSRLRLVVSGVLGWLFIFATVRIHPGNPMLYDVGAPCWLLVALVLLRYGTSMTRPRGATLALVGAGFFLSMFELARPYVILLVPVILAMVVARVGFSRRVLHVLVPLVLISGTWHVHQAVAHRQLTASNHFGVNLWRCWSSKVPPLANPVPEDDAPLSPGRWPNLDNPQHLKNSLRLRKKIARYVLAHPGESLAFVVHRLRVLTAGETAIYGHRPQHAVFAIYRPLVRVLFVWTLAGFGYVVVVAIWRAVRDRGALRAHLANLDNLILFIAGATTIILAIGEADEEARFVVSLLPLLAVVPHIDRVAAVLRQRSMIDTR